MVIWKRRDPPQEFSDYRNYKSWLREDFNYSCVYCSIHEGEFGGLHSFHVEHFKPKSKFPRLETDYSNLLYACWRCNSFKGEDWPSDNPCLSGEGYIDPCRYDYAKCFTAQSDGLVIGEVPAAVYMIERLHLNCNFLIQQRKQRGKIIESIEKYRLVIAEIGCLLRGEKSESKIKSLEEIESNMLSLLKWREAEWNARISLPYEPEDLR